MISNYRRKKMNNQNEQPENDTDGGQFFAGERHQDAKLLRWVMRQVAKEIRDDPEFTDPFYERMAQRIIAHAFALFARWLAFAVIGSCVGALLIWLGTIGVFFK